MSTPSTAVPSLEGRTALVTGAGSGIGRAGAHAFAQLGARVVLADLRGDTAREVASEIEADGGVATGIECDVRDESAVAAMISAAVDFGDGRLDAAFNNAGDARGQFPLHETPLDEWQASIESNLTGTFLCLKHELVHMLEAGGGAIVNMSSGAARVAAPGRVAYSAAKRGVIGLTTQAANDYRRNGIRVNSVLPGLIDTPAIRGNHTPEQLEQLSGWLPAGRLGEPSEVAALAAWLCTDTASFINGQAIVADGGGILA